MDNQFGNFLKLEQLKAEKGVMVVPNPNNRQALTVLSSSGQVLVPETIYETPEHLIYTVNTLPASNNSGANMVAQGQTPSPIIQAGAGILSVNDGAKANGKQFTYAFPKCSKQKLLVIGDLTGNLLISKAYTDADVTLESGEGFTDQQNPGFAANESLGSFFTGAGAFNRKPNLLSFLDLDGFSVGEISAQINDGNVTCTILNSVKYYRMQNNQSYSNTPEFVQNTFTLTAGTFSKNVQLGKFIDQGAQIGKSNAIVLILPVIDGPFQITLTIYPTADWVKGRS